MKKILILIIIVAVFIPFSAYANGRFELGASYSSTSKISKLDTIFEAEHRKKDLGITINSHLRHEQVDDQLINFDFLFDLQANYYIPQYPGWYAYLGSGYVRDINMGVDDQINIGLGGGWKNERFSAQSGLYTQVANENMALNQNVINKTCASAHIHLVGPLSLQEKMGFEINLTGIENEEFSIFSSTFLIAKLSKPLYISAGMDYKYDNRPVAGYPHDSRDWLIKIGMEF